jgi:hypothetical protein
METRKAQGASAWEQLRENRPTRCKARLTVSESAGCQEVRKSETDAKSKADKLGGMKERLPDNIPMKGLISRRLDASQPGASLDRVVTRDYVPPPWQYGRGRADSS